MRWEKSPTGILSRRTAWPSTRLAKEFTKPNATRTGGAADTQKETVIMRERESDSIRDEEIRSDANRTR